MLDIIPLPLSCFFPAKDEHMECFKRAMEALAKSDELWERYFIDFTHQQLHMEYVEDGISTPLMKAAFDTYVQQKEDRVVALHVYFHVHQLELAKVAILLRSLNKIKQMVSQLPLSPPSQSSSSSISSEYIKAAQKTKKIVGEAADLTVFITDALFSVLVGVCTTEEGAVLDNMLSWYRTYNGVVRA